jgi:hypothetical protein
LARLSAKLIAFLELFRGVGIGHWLSMLSLLYWKQSTTHARCRFSISRFHIGRAPTATSAVIRLPRADEGFAAMTRYRVSFFKNLRGFDGHTSRSLQQAIVIRRTKSVERAVEAAKLGMSAAAMWLTRGVTRTALSWRSMYSRLTRGEVTK